MKTIYKVPSELDILDLEIILNARLMKKGAVKQVISQEEARMSEMLKDKSIDRKLCERQNILIGELIDIYNSK